MDFAWVVDALRRGLKVTRKSWAGDPPMYLYLVKDKSTHQKHIMCYTGTSHDFEWSPPTDLMLDANDWEEYVVLKVDGGHHTGDTMTVEEYQRMHNGEKCMSAPRQEGPFVINPLPVTTTREMRGWCQAAEDQSEHAKEARKAVANEEHQKELLDTLVNAFAELVSQRVAQLLQDKKEPDHV